MLIFAVILAILRGLCFNGTPSAVADEEDRYAYSYSKINVTADENKILKVEENLTVGFLKDTNYFSRAVRGNMKSYYGFNGAALRGRGFLSRISDITAEVDGVPAQAELADPNGLNHHITIEYPDGRFKQWTYENQLYYDVKLCYTYDLSDDADGKNMFFINLFDHYYSRWFYFDGDSDNVATLEYNITFPQTPADGTALLDGNKKSDGVTVDGSTVSAVIPMRGAGSFSLRVPFGEDVFETAAEYFPYYWYFAGTVGLIILFGLVVTFIFRARKPLAPVEYEPPIMNPLHFSAFWHGYARRRDACTLILQWAHLGCVRIKKDGNRDIILTKLKDLPEGRTVAEYRYFAALFEDGEVYRSKAMRGWANRHKRYRIRYAATELAEEAGTPVTRAKGVESAKVVVMFSSLMALLVSCTYFLVVADDIIFMTFLVAIVFAFCMFARGYPLLLQMRQKRQAYKGAYRLSGILASVLILPPALMLLILIQAHYMPVYDYIHITVISLIWVFVCLYVTPNFIAKRTEEAQKTYGRILGFKKFLTAVKVSEMELMLEKNPDYYLDVLPYCMIIGLSKKLDKKTEFIAAPEWADGFDGATFASSLFGSMKRAVITRKKKERK